MTPAEHYAEAERWIGRAEDLAKSPVEGLLPAYDTYLRRAQVHATLATVGPGDWSRHLTPEPETGDYWPEDR